MALNEALLPEFDVEMANTRKALERVPQDKFDWKPHAKSGSLGWLSTHLAMLPGWATTTINQDSLDVAPVGGEPYRMPELKTPQELLAMFDKNVAEARRALAGAADDHLVKQWTLLAGGRQIFSMPRVAVLRSFVMNHLIHHRGQLTLYLRLNDIPVPGLYGPSADEGSM